MQVLISKENPGYKYCAARNIIAKARGGNVDENYRYWEIRLKELLKKRGMSKNKLSHKAEMSWKQIDSYCTNDITRLDVFVLCKLCTVLECRIEDLLVFYPPEKEKP